MAMRWVPVIGCTVTSLGLYCQLNCMEPHLRRLDARLLRMEAALLDAQQAMLTAAAVVPPPSPPARPDPIAATPHSSTYSLAPSTVTHLPTHHTNNSAATAAAAATLAASSAAAAAAFPSASLSGATGSLPLPAMTQDEYRALLLTAATSAARTAAECRAEALATEAAPSPFASLLASFATLLPQPFVAVSASAQPCAAAASSAPCTQHQL